METSIAPMSAVQEAGVAVCMPAEWEPHACTWMAWPPPAVWGDRLATVEGEYAAVAHAIRGFEPVRVVADPSAAAHARALLGSDIDVVELPIDDAWLRDSGPSFVRLPDRGLAGVCWRFNGWGGASPCGNDGLVGRRVLELLGLPAITSALAMEGGAIAVDGAGTLLATDSVTFNANRNPGLLREHAEAEFARTLGIRKTIWLPGDASAYGTNGHVDGLACFVRPGVVLFETAADETGPGAEVTRANRAALEGATDALGRAIEIIEVQEAPWGATDPLGEWGASNSYVNYFIANGGVVMPAFGMPGPDRAAYEAVVAAHPDRVVVQVPIPTLRTGGGGIHCITQQQPV